MTPNSVIRGLTSSAPFIAPEALEARLGVKFTARIGANESAFGPSPLAISAIEDSARLSSLYGDPQAVELRSALAESLGVDADNIVIGPGIDGLLIHLCRAYLEPGRSAATTLGSYPTFEYAAEQTGANIIRLPYDHGQCNLRELSATSANVIYLANPDNPSGSYWGPDSLLGFLTSVPESSLVILDEAYGDFVPDLLPAFLELRNVVRLRTFSKAHGLAGLRIGYAIGEPETLAPLHRVRGHFEVSSIAQAAALASLKDVDFLTSVIERVEDGKRDLAAILTRHGLDPLLSRTNFVLGRCSGLEAANQLIVNLLQCGIFVRKPAVGEYADCVRFTVGTAMDHRQLDLALSGI